MKRRSEIIFTSKINLNPESMAKLFQLAILALSAADFSFHGPRMQREAIDTLIDCGFSEDEIREMIEENFG